MAVQNLQLFEDRLTGEQNELDPICGCQFPLRKFIWLQLLSVTPIFDPPFRPEMLLFLWCGDGCQCLRPGM